LIGWAKGEVAVNPKKKSYPEHCADKKKKKRGGNKRVGSGVIQKKKKTLPLLLKKGVSVKDQRYLKTGWGKEQNGPSHKRKKTETT